MKAEELKACTGNAPAVGSGREGAKECSNQQSQLLRGARQTHSWPLLTKGAGLAQANTICTHTCVPVSDHACTSCRADAGAHFLYNYNYFLLHFLLQLQPLPVTTMTIYYNYSYTPLPWQRAAYWWGIFAIHEQLSDGLRIYARKVNWPPNHHGQ